MEIDLTQGRKQIHFIGIGGISMSGLAEILHSRGSQVTGSDANPSKITHHLEGLGLPVFYGHRRENVPIGTDLIVYTAAIKEGNPEILEGQQRGIPIIDRADLLGQIMKWYQYPIAISGTHGKTTTTSMVSEILLTAKKDPTVTVGGLLPSIGGNFRLGNSEYFVAESCEYYDSFLKFYPRIGVILNIENDHLDYFKDLAGIEASFHAFATHVPPEGTLILNQGISCQSKITEDLLCSVITYGTPSAHWYAENLSLQPSGRYAFDLIGFGEKKGRVHLGVYGKHNIENALAAAAACWAIGVDSCSILTGLENFKGVGRRFEYKGSWQGVTLIDDYAHHPTEIKACLQAARQYPHQRLWCIFQPHNFTRTQTLLAEFGKAFFHADKVILLDIYSNREAQKGGIHSLDLLRELQKNQVDSLYFSSFSLAEAFLRENCIPNDLLITMGAGDIYLLGESLLNTDLSTVSTVSTVSTE